MESLIIHLLVGLIVIVGFFWYWGKSSGVFKEGGVIREWWINYRAKKKVEKDNTKLTKKD